MHMHPSDLHVRTASSNSTILKQHVAERFYLKPATHLAILFADRGESSRCDQRKLQSPHRTHLTIFVDHRDWSIKSPGVSPALDRSLSQMLTRRLVWDQRRRVLKALLRADLSLWRKTLESKFIPIVIFQRSGYCRSFKCHCSTFISAGNIVGIMFPTL